LYTTLQKIRGRPRDAHKKDAHRIDNSYIPRTPSHGAQSRDALISRRPPRGRPHFSRTPETDKARGKEKQRPRTRRRARPRERKTSWWRVVYHQERLVSKVRQNLFLLNVGLFQELFFPLSLPLSLSLYIYIIYYRYILYSPTGGYTRQPEHLTCRMETNINSVQQCPTQRRRGERANEHIISN
jgi:hypothetical protein